MYIYIYVYVSPHVFFLRPEKRLSVQLVRWAATATALEPRSGGRPLMLGVDGI
jgi:hypothetical protein